MSKIVDDLTFFQIYARSPEGMRKAKRKYFSTVCSRHLVTKVTGRQVR